MCARGGRLHGVPPGRDLSWSGTSTRSRGHVRVDWEAVEVTRRAESAELRGDDIVAHAEDAEATRGALANLLPRCAHHLSAHRFVSVMLSISRRTSVLSRPLPVKPSTRFIKTPPCVLIPGRRPRSEAKGRGLRPRAPPSRFDAAGGVRTSWQASVFRGRVVVRTERAREPLSSSKYLYPLDALFSTDRPDSFTA